MLDVRVRPGRSSITGSAPSSELVRLPVEQQLDALARLTAADLHERAGVYDRRQQLVVLAEAEVVDRRAVRQRHAIEIDHETAAGPLGDMGCIARDPVGDVDERVRMRRQGLPSASRIGGRGAPLAECRPAAPSGPVTTSRSPGVAPPRPGTRSERPSAVTDR